MTKAIWPINAEVRAGPCEGGPLDGQRLEHDHSRYALTKCRPAEQTFLGLYMWEDGVWLWRPA